MLTASSLFLHCLAEVGITHVFVNWGSDHPALLEELHRQRAMDDRTTIDVITCPNEMVALSAAQGYAQVTGKPAALIIHVDVGTQALAGAIHNVDRSRTPVLIYAGASPFSSEKEHQGTRNEWIMWLQDIPDQSGIVRQYMRYTSQLHSGPSIPQVVRRALQIATSEPTGPVYLWARREVMEEEIPESLLKNSFTLSGWPSVEPSALSPKAVTHIAEALFTAHSPLIITSFLGRNKQVVPLLVNLSSILAIPVVSSCPSAVNMPSSHFNFITYLFPGTHHPSLSTADVILIIDCDLPYIPANDRPNPSAHSFIIDSGDPLKLNVGQWHADAEMVCHADAYYALDQLLHALETLEKRAIAETGHSVLNSSTILRRRKDLEEEHKQRINSLEALENLYPDSNETCLTVDGGLATFNVPNLLGILRKAVQTRTPSHGENVLYLNESISNYGAVWTHLRPADPGSMFTSGGSSLGWALGAAVGAHMGSNTLRARADKKSYDLIVIIVGDGSFLFGVPSSAYWMAQRYETPFLTIVLNNGGWRSPKLSMLAMHPTGYGSQTPSHHLSTSFGPTSPDYAQIAVAASGGWAWGKRVGGTSGFNGGAASGDRLCSNKDASDTRLELEQVISEAIRVVLEEKRCAVVDCVIESL